jgi:hypothetical protein
MTAWAVWRDRRSQYGDIYLQRYDSLMNKAGGNIRVNDDISTITQQTPAVDCDSAGNAVVVWRDDRYPFAYGQRFDKDGNRQGGNFRVKPDSINGFYDNVDVAMLPDGGFVTVGDFYHYGLSRNIILGTMFNASGAMTGVFYVDSASSSKTNAACGVGGNRLIASWYDGRGSNWAVYVRAFDLTGNPLGPSQAASDGSASLSDIHSLRPGLAVGDTGQFCVVWQDCRNGNPDIYAQRFDCNAAAQGANFRVNQDAGSAHQYYPMAMYVKEGYALGQLYISWLDYSAGDQLFWAGYYPNGTMFLNGPLLDNSHRPSGRHELTACFMSSYGYYVPLAWDAQEGSNNEVYAMDLNSPSTKARCNDDALGAYQNAPSVCADSLGRWAVVWSDERRLDQSAQIYGLPFEASGLPFGSDEMISDSAMNSSGAYYPCIAANPGGDFVCAWHTYQGITGIIGNLDVGPIGGNRRFSADTLNGWTKMYAAAAIDDQGRFLLAWIDSRNGVYYEVYCRGFGPGAVPRTGQDLKLNLTGAEANGYVPKAAPLGGGRFAVCYNQESGSYADLYCRLVEIGSDTVTFVGDPFKVSDNPDGTFSYVCALGADTAGNFLAAWYDSRYYNVRARWYSRDGVPLGDGFDVSDNYHYPEDINIAVDRQGRSLVFWTNNHDWQNVDIYARAYTAAHTPYTAQFKVNNDPTARHQGAPYAAAGGGRFFLAWEDCRYDTCGTDIFAKGYTWEELGVAGKPGSELKVASLKLLPNAPNPFGQITTIRYQLSKAGKVGLRVYNAAGQLVRTLVCGYRAAGEHQVVWDGRDEAGRQVSNGVYLYRLEAGGEAVTGRMALVR